VSESLPNDGSREASTAVSADVPKPVELLAIGDACAELFGMLRSWFEVPEVVTLELVSVDSDQVVRQLADPQMVAALAMRKLQALHLLAVPGVRTTTDVVVTLIDSVLRALVEAPRTRIRHEVSRVDWDHEWTVMDAGMLWRSHCPDDEIERFEDLVEALVLARDAMLDASGSEISIFS
jgi:hypothetical protein